MRRVGRTCSLPVFGGTLNSTLLRLLYPVEVGGIHTTTGKHFVEYKLLLLTFIDVLCDFYVTLAADDDDAVAFRSRPAVYGAI